MYEITAVRKLSDRIYYMEVTAPYIAGHCLPGEFVIVRLDEKGERIPLTICDYDREKGSISIVFQSVGYSTGRMALLQPGDAFSDVSGPLGNPSELVLEKNLPETREKRILFVAGGVGTAPVYPQVKWLHAHGVSVDVIIGARSKELIFFEEEMRAVADVHICTDDGSYGFHGNTCDMIRALVNEGRVFDHVVAIGPCIMMKFVCLLTKELGIHTVVSMNPIMVDGTGMCGACRLHVGGELKFACVDGPEFDGHLVDFDETMKRQRIYRTEEGRAMLKLTEGESHHGGCGKC